MKARVTEKIAKGCKLTILKHTSCTVVGWVLHEGDRKNEKGVERLLNYLPRIIFVFFEGATWRVHPGLPVGVFPLKPVNRDWVVNEGTGAKATRKGFTLVPDFASTGFMIQGVTADAAIAECGDVMSLAGLAEMVNTYVILSRVRRADCLLLLRAFSPYLFQQGAPPGPLCLLKLLRYRLRSATPNSTAQGHMGAAQNIATSTSIAQEQRPYTIKDAKEEYSAETARWEGHRKAQKAKGVEWQCFGCCLKFPAEGYGARSTSTAEVHLHCMTPGHWRRCLACTQAPPEGCGAT
jgi:hypothetical protein